MRKHARTTIQGNIKSRSARNDRVSPGTTPMTWLRQLLTFECRYQAAIADIQFVLEADRNGQ